MLAAAEQLPSRSAKPLIERLNESRAVLLRAASRPLFSETASKALLLETASRAPMPESFDDASAQSSIRPAAPGPSSVPTMQLTVDRTSGHCLPFDAMPLHYRLTTSTSSTHGVLHVRKQVGTWQNTGLELSKLHKVHAEQLNLCKAPSHVQTVSDKACKCHAVPLCCLLSVRRHYGALLSVFATHRVACD